MENRGVNAEKLKVTARSIEYVHAASLAHDDVIDNATTRRGKPSINIEGDNKMSILAGDFLLAEVINDLSDLGNLDVVVEMASIIRRLSLASGYNTIVLLIESILQIYLRKSH